MTRKIGAVFGATDRAELSKAINTEMARRISLEELRPYPEPHENGRCVYVLQLRDDVWDCASCAKLFKGVKDRRTAFYVGSTGKSIAYRLEQHLAYLDHKSQNVTRATQVAPHILRREPRLEPHEGPKGLALEKRIKWHSEMRELEEFVLPRIIRNAGFAVYAGGKSNPDGTRKKTSTVRNTRRQASAKD